MIRVSLEYPCPICGKSDWCLRSPDGKLVICPRTLSDKMIGEAGYLHILEKAAKKIPYTQILKTQKYPINWDALQALYAQKFDDAFDGPDEYAISLGIGYDGEARTFPMRLPDMTIVGIQRRLFDGSKIMVKGSKAGLFIPTQIGNVLENYTLVCEGCSDCLAGLALSYPSIGRLSCNNGQELVLEFIKRHQAARPIIIADNDTQGVRGAQKLMEKLLMNGIKCGILVPHTGIKDLREWFEKGLTKQDLQEEMDDIWKWLQE